jgi:hypothetical protein
MADRMNKTIAGIGALGGSAATALGWIERKAAGKAMVQIIEEGAESSAADAAFAASSATVLLWVGGVALAGTAAYTAYLAYQCW